ncbi:hypothetical protein H1C71_033227, partial [Ictidomys tridecemlineatus]
QLLKIRAGNLSLWLVLQEPVAVATLSRRPPSSELGCPVWLQVPVPVPRAGPSARQPSVLCPWGREEGCRVGWHRQEDLGDSGRAQWPVCEAQAGADWEAVDCGAWDCVECPLLGCVPGCASMPVA